MAYDAEFYDGFMTSTAPAGIALTAGLFGGEWTSYAPASGGSIAIGAALSGTGGSLAMTPSASGGLSSLVRTVPGNYARFIGGARINAPLLQTFCICELRDAGTAQISLTLETSGQFGIREGTYNSTLLASSAQSISANVTHYVEWDITINNTTGIYKVWLDGVLTSLSATGVNTRYGTSNNYANQRALGLAPAAAG